MKTLKLIVFINLILASGFLIISCQKEAGNSLVLPQGNPMLKSFTMPDCSTGCLQQGPFYQENTSETLQWGHLSAFPGYFKNNKYMTATAWNDTNNLYIRADVNGYQYSQTGGKIKTLVGPSNNNYPFTTVIITLNNTTYTYSMDDPLTPDIIEKAVSYTQAFPLPDDWAACDEQVYTVRLQGGGQPIGFGNLNSPDYFTYHLYSWCDCEPSFLTASDTCIADGTTVYPVGSTSYEGNRIVTLSYTPEQDGFLVVQGSLTSVTQVGFIPTNPFIGGSLDLVSVTGEGPVYIVFEGPVTTCVENTFTFVWYSLAGETSITGEWSAELFEDATKTVLVEELTIPPITCGE